MTSTFDPTQLLNAQFTEANATKIDPHPAGEFVMTIADVPEFNSFEIKKGERAGQMLHKVSFQLRSIAPGEPHDGKTVRHDVILDVTPQGGLDFGPEKNVGLGRLREACGLNVPGAPFSFSQFPGRSLRVQVIHEPSDKDPATLYARVKAVSKA